jgi:iron complex outermembrane recepter protein
LSGDKISEAGLQRFDQLAAYIPNFTVTQYEIGDVINIRGLASGIQAGFEQSVGTFVDGVYRGRSVQSRFAFLDVGTIEVLRGPQGTLFGKNTIAGAVNITSAKPTHEFEGEIRSTYNLEFEELQLDGYLSGSLSDTVRARAAFISREMDEGWVKNLAYNSNDPNTDELAGRVSFEWDAGDNTQVAFKYEAGNWDNNGQPMELVNAGPFALLGIEDNIDYQSNFGGVGDNVLDIGSVQTFEGDIEEFAITLTHTLNSGSEITAIAAQSEYDYQRAIDADLSPLPRIRFDDDEELQQTSFELRIASDTASQFEYIGGVYYHQADLTAEGITYASINSVNSLSTAGCAVAGGTQTLAVTGTNANADTAYNCELALVTGTLPLDGVGRYAKLEQDTETWAAFAQTTWNITDTLRTTLGVRYTEEVKKANQGVYAVDYLPGNTRESSNLVNIASAEQLLEFTTHDFSDLKRDEESFTWSGNIQWDVSTNTMAYATASTGFKAGGFNSFFMGSSAGGGAASSDVDFDEEDVLAFEIGSKMSLLEGAAELNIALFRTEFDNLQVSVFSGNTTFSVQNAAEATTQGIEIDGRWQVTDALLLNGSFGWTDFEFDRFSNQACTAEQYANYLEQAYSGGNFAAAGVGVVPGFFTAKQRLGNQPDRKKLDR